MRPVVGRRHTNVRSPTYKLRGVLETAPQLPARARVTPTGSDRQTERGVDDGVIPARNMEGRNSVRAGEFRLPNAASQMGQGRGPPHAIVGIRHRGGAIHTGQGELSTNMMAPPTEGPG